MGGWKRDKDRTLLVRGAVSWFCLVLFCFVPFARKCKKEVTFYSSSGVCDRVCVCVCERERESSSSSCVAFFLCFVRSFTLLTTIINTNNSIWCGR